MSEKMTKEQAIQLFEQIIEVYKGSKKDFELLAQAVELLKNLKECECPIDENIKE